MERLQAGEIARWVQGEVVGLSSQEVLTVSKIDDPVRASLCFLANPKYDRYLYSPVERTVLVERSYRISGPTGATIIRVDNVYDSFAKVLNKLDSGSPATFHIDELSSVHPEAKVSEMVSIGKFAVIEKNASIGRFTTVGDQVYIGENVVLGQACKIYPGVKIYGNCKIGDRVVIHSNAVIGSDGFGYAEVDSGYIKIPHNGDVVIEDDVEIGSNTCIDRGSLGSTFIRRGAKLDNLIQIAHNVEIGENVAIAAQAGISGSAKIGQNAQLGGQVGVVGHVQIAPGSKIQAQSGIASSISTAGKKWYGSPILSYYDYLRSYSFFKKLPSLVRRLEDLEKRIKK